MSNSIQSIALHRLVPHPDNPNRMSKANFTKLLRNIDRTGRYEPLVVRPCPRRADLFQIINGHHRCRALRKLGHKTADAVVWNIDDQQTDILLATLNRLGGSDEFTKKLDLLKRLRERLTTRELASLLPQSAKQIERLTSFSLPGALAEVAGFSMANPLVFFVKNDQKRIIQGAISLAEDSRSNRSRPERRAAALTMIAKHFLSSPEQPCGKANTNGPTQVTAE
jgi:ParB/RepB/Spo0J family partition protein